MTPAVTSLETSSVTHSAAARWVFDEFGVSVRSVAIARILFCATLLIVMFPRYPWMADFPTTAYAPPLGIAAMFESQPSAAVLWAMVTIAVVLTMLLMVGWHTRAVGLALSATLLLCNSFEYAFGKINHDILLIITLAVMSFSDWGEAFSFDARRRPPNHDCLANPVRWPIALLVMITGLCMSGAAIAKVRGGWLDPQSSATLGHMLSNFYVQHRDVPLAAAALKHFPTWAWEAMDWSTVLIEISFFPAAFSLRGTRWVYGLALLFHAGVQYTMHIFFWPNLLTYAIVVNWESIVSPALMVALSRWVRAIAAWQILVLGLLLTAGMYAFGNLTQAALHPIGLGENHLNSILMTAVLLGTGYHLFKLMRKPAQNISTPPVMLFDGVCGLCNHAVDFVIARDAERVFRFSPLQSAAGRAVLKSHGLDENYIDSIVLVRGDHIDTHSTAALQIARLLGWPWKLLYVFVLCPPLIRDGVYDFIARHRYRWFGRTEACRLPTPAEREQFI